MKHCGRTFALVVALATAVTLGAARPSAAQLAATDLGTLDGFSSSGAMAINASGMAVGFVYNTNTYGYPEHTLAAVWSPGATTPAALPLLAGYTDSMAQFVNASGQVAGTCDNGVYNKPQACVWTFDGTNWAVTGLGFLASGDTSEVYGMNAAGQVIGQSGVKNSDSRAGFIWDSTNGMQAFTNLPEGPNGTTATIEPAPSHGISDNGLVVGTAMTSGYGLNGAIVWDSKTKQTVAYLQYGEALAISPSGNHVAGYRIPNPSEYFVRESFLWTWDADQTQFTLTDLGHPAYDSGSVGWTLNGHDVYPTAVTDDGKVLGFGRNYWDTDSPPDGYGNTSGPDETWVYASGTYTDLATLLPAGTVGQVETQAFINASGAVAFNLMNSSGYTPYYWNGSDDAVALASLRGAYAGAMDVNDSGMVAGASSVTADSPMPVHATRWGQTPSALDFSASTLSVKTRTLAIKLKVVVTNASGSLAKGVRVTEASLDGEATATALPLALPTITPGASKTISLAFDGQGLASGSEVELKISGTCSLGDFFTTQTVIIP